MSQKIVGKKRTKSFYKGLTAAMLEYWDKEQETDNGKELMSSNRHFNVSTLSLDNGLIDNPWSLFVLVLISSLQTSENDEYIKSNLITWDMIFSRAGFKSKLTEKRKQVNSVMNDLIQHDVIKVYKANTNALVSDINDVKSKELINVWQPKGNNDASLKYFAIQYSELETIFKKSANDNEKVMLTAIFAIYMSDVSYYIPTTNHHSTWKTLYQLFKLISMISYPEVSKTINVHEKTVGIYVRKLEEIGVLKSITVRLVNQPPQMLTKLYTRFSRFSYLLLFAELMLEGNKFPNNSKNDIKDYSYLNIVFLQTPEYVDVSSKGSDKFEYTVEEPK